MSSQNPYSFTMPDAPTGITANFTQEAQPLTASISASPTSGYAPLTVQFTSQVSGGVPPYTYQWDFGDGSTSSAANPTHTYESAGDFTAYLTVTDSQGNQQFLQTQITVTQSPTAQTYSATFVMNSSTYGNTVTVTLSNGRYVTLDSYQSATFDGLSGTLTWSASPVDIVACREPGVAPCYQYRLTPASGTLTGSQTIDLEYLYAG